MQFRTDVGIDDQHIIFTTVKRSAETSEHRSCSKTHWCLVLVSVKAMVELNGEASPLVPNGKLAAHFESVKSFSEDDAKQRPAKVRYFRQDDGKTTVRQGHGVKPTVR
jgi:hypothetical protein